MKNKLTFSIIGSGKIAQFWLQMLQHYNFKIQGIWARNCDTAQLLSKQYQCQNYQLLTAIEDMEQHICILAVSDEAIPLIAAQLHFSNTLLIHCSGANPLDILTANAQHCGVLWPPMSIRNNTLFKSEDWSLCYEANNPKSNDQLQILAQTICSNTYQCNSLQRQYLHLAAVLSNNFTNHLISIAQELLQTQQLPFSMLMPIIRQSFIDYSQYDAKTLQTGPAIRNDEKTMLKQSDLLAQTPEWQALYQSFNKSIKKMYNKNEPEA